MSAGLIRRLGDTHLTPEDGAVGVLDLLARSGLPVPEGFVLTREGHRSFLRFNGLRETPQAGEAEGSGGDYERSTTLRSGVPSLSSEELTKLVRDAVLDLDSRTVCVVWEGGHHSGLRSLSEVFRAIRGAWLPEREFQRPNKSTLADGEPPNWPVLVQREPQPEYTGWSTTEDSSAAPGVPSYPAPPEPGSVRSTRKMQKTHRGGITLYDVKPAGPTRRQRRAPDQIRHEVSRQSIASLTSQAGHALGTSVSLKWGLEDGRWYVLSASRLAPERDQNS